MTSPIIYHDFQSKNTGPAVAESTPAVLLTASVLAKGRRLAAIHNAVNVACLTLCGACIGVSICIFCALFGVI